MPSPYGRRRQADMYYEHAEDRRGSTSNWTGMPLTGGRAGETRGLGEDGDYIDVTATLHKHLGDWDVQESAFAGRRSMRHSGVEQTHLNDGMGAFGLSRNENRLAIVAVVGVAAYFAFQFSKKKSKRKSRR